MTLHRGGKGGPSVSFIDKEAMSNDMLLRMPWVHLPGACRPWRRLTFFPSFSPYLSLPPFTRLDLPSRYPRRNSNGWHTPLTQGNFFSSSHEFTGFDGQTSYKWKRASMSSDWTVRLFLSLFLAL